MLGRVPERKAGQGFVLVDVDAAAGAEHVLPGLDVARAAGVVGRVVRSRGLGKTTAQGRLERPEVGTGADRRHGAHRRAPRAGELRSSGAIAVVDGDVAGVVHALVPAVDEPGIDVRRAGARVTGRLDVDREHAAFRDAEPLRGGDGLDRVLVAGRVRGDVAADVLVVDREEAHV